MRTRFVDHFAGLGKRCDQRLPKKQAGLIGRTSIRGRRTREANIDFPAIKRGVLTARHIFDKTQCHAWMTCLIFAQETGKKAATGEALEADSECSNLPLGCPLRCGNGSGCLSQRLDRFLVKRLAFGREPCGSSISREELDAQLALQVRYSLTDRRLSDKEVP